jgi:hypothetical protein
MSTLHVAAPDDRYVERRPEAEPVEPVERGSRRTRHEGVLSAVDDERGEIGDWCGGSEGAAIGMGSDLVEDAALDSATKTTGAEPGGADLARRDRSVLTCRDVR